MFRSSRALYCLLFQRNHIISCWPLLHTVFTLMFYVSNECEAGCRCTRAHS